MEYNVMLEVDTDDDLDIVDYSCDCPYDWGLYCKHVVAMMYYIKEKELYKQSVTENTFHKIEQDLAQFDKEELIYLLVELCKDKQTIKKMIMKELGYDK